MARSTTTPRLLETNKTNEIFVEKIKGKSYHSYNAVLYIRTKRKGKPIFIYKTINFKTTL